MRKYVCTKDKYQKADTLTDLAAAYARRREFDRAILYQQRVIKLRKLNGQFHNEAHNRLMLYKNKKAHQFSK